MGLFYFGKEGRHADEAGMEVAKRHGPCKSTTLEFKLSFATNEHQGELIMQSFLPRYMVRYDP
jgi:hypothetical protein